MYEDDEGGNKYAAQEVTHRYSPELSDRVEDRDFVTDREERVCTPIGSRLAFE